MIISKLLGSLFQTEFSKIQCCNNYNTIYLIAVRNIQETFLKDKNQLNIKHFVI